MAETIKFLFRRGVVDAKGSITFDSDGFTICYPGKKRFVNYVEVGEVSRFYHDRQMGVGIRQAVPNLYRIELKNGGDIEFCVAFREYDAYKKAVSKLQRKIYGGNRLGVHFSAKVEKVDAKARRQMNKRFEMEKPSPDYTLVMAIDSILEHCGLTLKDYTKYGSVGSRATTKAQLLTADDVFVEIANLISNYDEAVARETISCVERWEEYRKTAKRGMTLDTPDYDVKWFAMIDTLEKYGYAAETAWNDTAEHISQYLKNIKEVLNVSLDTSPEPDELGREDDLESVDILRLLTSIEATLSAQGWHLCNIDFEANTFALCLLKHESYKSCEKLLQGTQFSVSIV